jgi:hypothetical protein
MERRLPCRTDRPARPSVEGVEAEWKGSALAGLVRVVPMSRINAMLVVSPQPRYIDEARRVYTLIDRARQQTIRSWHVHYLRNSHADDMAYVLRQAFTPNKIVIVPAARRWIAILQSMVPRIDRHLPTLQMRHVPVRNVGLTRDQRPQALPGRGIVRNVAPVQVGHGFQPFSRSMDSPAIEARATPRWRSTAGAIRPMSNPRMAIATTDSYTVNPRSRLQVSQP